MNKYLISFIGLILIGIGAIVYYWYTLPMPLVESKEADYRYTAEEFFEMYEQDENAANSKFLDKLILIEGRVQKIVTEGNQLSVILDTGRQSNGIVCEIDQRLHQNFIPPDQGQMVSIKGVCSGMLLDVILVRCVLIA